MDTLERVGKSLLYTFPTWQEPYHKVYFLLDSEDEDLPSSLPLAETWTHRGHYLFVVDLIVDPVNFAVRVLTYLRQAAPQARVVWVLNLYAHLSQANVRVLIGTEETRSRLMESSTFQWRNYEFSLRRNCRVWLDVAKGVLCIDQPKHGSVFMRATVNGERQFVIDDIVTIPLYGEQAGTFQFEARLNESHLSLFKIGLHYASPNTRQYRRFDTYTYPLFALNPTIPYNMGPTESVTLRASLDPLKAEFDAVQLDPTRSYFAFPVIEHHPLILRTFFRTPQGAVVALVPQAGARLIFMPLPYENRASNKDSYYLAPVGTFQAVVRSKTQPRESASQLVFGTGEPDDILKLQKDGLIEFVPNHAAFAPYFPTESDEWHSAAENAYMNHEFLTSWVRAVGTEQALPIVLYPEALPDHERLAHFDRSVLAEQRKMLRSPHKPTSEPVKKEEDQTEKERKDV